MTAAVKKNLPIVAIAGVCGSILTVWALTGKICAYAKESYIVPCVDARIDEKTKLPNEKLEVLYQYTLELAKANGTADLWNQCVDKVYTSNKVGKLER